MSDQQTDEISLIDLVAVLVRYRRLVLGLPVVVAIVAAVWLYAMPRVFGAAAPAAITDVVVERELFFEPLPARVSGYFDRTPQELVEAMLEDVRVLAPVYQSFDWSGSGMRTFASGEDAALRNYLRSSVVGDRLTQDWSSADRTLLLRFRSSDEETSRAFMNALITALEREFPAVLAAELDRADRAAAAEIRAAESTIGFLDGEGLQAWSAAGASGVTAAVDVLASATVARELIADMRADPLGVFSVSDDLLVYAGTGDNGPGGLAQSRSVQLVVAVFAAGFFAIFLSFVLNYVRMVRSDSESMQTLSQAWKRE